MNVCLCVFVTTLEHLSSILHSNSWWIDDGFITAQWALGLGGILGRGGLKGETETSPSIKIHSFDSVVPTFTLYSFYNIKTWRFTALVASARNPQKYNKMKRRTQISHYSEYNFSFINWHSSEQEMHQPTESLCRLNNTETCGNCVKFLLFSCR